MRTLTIAVYAVFGAAALLAGAVGLVAPGTLFQEASSPFVAHLLREQAAGFVFIGLMFFWCLRHVDARRPVHVALLVFTALFAGIHWFDYLRDPGPIRYAVVNTLPVVALLVTAPLGGGPSGGRS